MAGGAGAVQAMLVPLESVWIQVHVVAVAIPVVGLRTSWSRAVILIMMRHTMAMSAITGVRAGIAATTAA